MNPYVVIVSGWRFATIEAHGRTIHETLLPIYQRHGSEVLLREGECPYGGVDAIAKLIGLLWGWQIDENPADWKRFGKGAGMLRNKSMCAKGGDELLAFPGPGSTGTLDCITWAEHYRIPFRSYLLPSATYLLEE